MSYRLRNMSSLRSDRSRALGTCAALLVSAVVVASCGADATTSASGTVSQTPTVESPTVESPTVETATAEPSPTNAPQTPPTPAPVERAPVDAAAPVDELAAGFNDAGFELMRTQPADANLVLSPLSVGHALLMARGAADGPTGAAIDAAFSLPEGIAADDAWNALDAAISESNASSVAIDGSDTPVVTIADRLWPAASTAPAQDWVDLLATHHGATVETIDVTDPEGSRTRINDWISEQTNGLIPELLPEGFVNADTVLVLTDTVYFNAQWRSVFGKYGPEDGPFTRLDGSKVDTTYLVDLEQPGPRGTGDGYVGAEVPYLGEDYSMLLVVPDEGRFDEVRQRLSQDLLDEIDATFTTGPYELRMPEWETNSAIDLVGWLADFGIAPGAYPGIGPEVTLEGAVHGADISVDERGTEAAAATALAFAESGPPEPELVVAADKPFFYVVRHVDSGAVLFAGQVTDPTA